MKLSNTAVNQIHNFWRHANLVVRLLQSREESYSLLAIFEAHCRKYEYFSVYFGCPDLASSQYERASPPALPVQWQAATAPSRLR